MDTKQKIITTAFQTFYQQGFHACGVELLAANAGVTKRTLYAHFGSKDGLIEAVLEYRHQQSLENLQTVLSQCSAENFVQTYLDYMLNWARSAEFHGCLFINTCAEYDDKSTPQNQQAASHKQDVRNLLRHYAEQVGLRHATELADTLFVFGEGITAAAKTGQLDAVETAKTVAENWFK